MANPFNARCTCPQVGSLAEFKAVYLPSECEVEYLTDEQRGMTAARVAIMRAVKEAR